jgi:hypothetical protein
MNAISAEAGDKHIRLCPQRDKNNAKHGCSKRPS